MRFLALNTDIDAVKLRFVSHGEREVITVFFHGFKFFMVALRKTVFTAVLVLPVLALRTYAVDALFIDIGFGAIWALFVFVPLLKAFLDWQYDFVVVTTDKVVLVDQSSVFHHKIKPINLENLASVSVETQFWNLLPFGILHLDLKEGVGESVRLPYIPRVHFVAGKLSDTITLFQRHKEQAGRGT